MGYTTRGNGGKFGNCMKSSSHFGDPEAHQSCLDTTKRYGKTANLPSLDTELGPSQPHFGEILGEPLIDAEQNVNARLTSLEQFINPLRNEVVVYKGKARFLNFGSAVGGVDEYDEMEDLSEDIY